jgi:hypothetical protein
MHQSRIKIINFDLTHILNFVELVSRGIRSQAAGCPGCPVETAKGKGGVDKPAGRREKKS